MLVQTLPVPQTRVLLLVCWMQLAGSQALSSAQCWQDGWEGRSLVYLPQHSGSRVHVQSAGSFCVGPALVFKGTDTGWSHMRAAQKPGRIRSFTVKSASPASPSL